MIKNNQNETFGQKKGQEFKRKNSAKIFILASIGGNQGDRNFYTRFYVPEKCV